LLVFKLHHVSYADWQIRALQIGTFIPSKLAKKGFGDWIFQLIYGVQEDAELISEQLVCYARAATRITKMKQQRET
jgi:hypothetical protein